MKKHLGTLLLLLASYIFKGLRSGSMGHMELARLKVSLMYVRSIKTFRLLFLSLLSIGICLVFLLVGLVLLHVSLFLYAPWSMGTKMLIGLLCSLVYLSVTVLMVSQVFDSNKWLKIFHADTILDHLHKEAVQKDATKKS